MRIIKKNFDENLMKRFFNTCMFSNSDNNKLILLLRKSVYSYNDMDDSEKVHETSLPEIIVISLLQSLKYGRYCWCRLRVYKKSKKVVNIKNLGDYQGLYARSDTLLVANVFENFPNICLEIYKIHRVHFFLHQDKYDKQL